MKRIILPIMLFLSFIFVLTVSLGLADPPPPQYIQFSPSTTKGALYYPDPAVFPNPHIAFIFIHRTANYLSHPTNILYVFCSTHNRFSSFIKSNGPLQSRLDTNNDQRFFILGDLIFFSAGEVPRESKFSKASDILWRDIHSRK